MAPHLPAISPGVRNSRELEVWRVRDLRDLELRRAEGAAASERPHVHAEFEIAVVEPGGQRVRHRGASHTAPTGTLIVIPPGEVHAHEGLGDDALSRSFFPDLISSRSRIYSVPGIPFGSRLPAPTWITSFRSRLARLR